MEKSESSVLASTSYHASTSSSYLTQSTSFSSLTWSKIKPHYFDPIPLHCQITEMRTKSSFRITCSSKHSKKKGAGLPRLARNCLSRERCLNLSRAGYQQHGLKRHDGACNQHDVNMCLIFISLQLLAFRIFTSIRLTVLYSTTWIYKVLYLCLRLPWNRFSEGVCWDSKLLVFEHEGRTQGCDEHCQRDTLLFALSCFM